MAKRTKKQILEEWKARQPERDRVTRMLEETGFTVEACYGWFDRTPFHGGEDMVFVARAV